MSSDQPGDGVVRWVPVVVLLILLASVGFQVGSIDPTLAGPSSEPFGSWAQLVDRQYLDLAATAPTASQRANAVAALAGASMTPGGLVAALRTSEHQATNVDPAIRLYRAFFLRIPDRDGLRYWVARRQSGTWTLVEIANFFASSSEFKTRYGNLSNRSFVKLIYDNVLERPYDQGGLDYWTRQLDSGRRARGSVMTGFSESNEYRTKQSSEVTVSALTILMLNKTPSTSAFTADVAALDSGESVTTYAEVLLGSPAYAARLATLAPVTVSAGGQHTCQVRQDGTVDCWGQNIFGGLGDGTNRDHETPTRVPGLSDAVSVSAGSWHSCALRANGTAVCWGENVYGQLGDGTNTRRFSPVAVKGLAGATQIDAGDGNTCALLTNATVKCWGYNQDWGQVGDGTTINRNIPTTVKGLSGVSSISVGVFHTCAALTNGTAKCWGENSYGKLGDGTTTARKTPTTVTGLTGVTSISTGFYGSCAVLANATAKCWGYNAFGTVGDGTTKDRLTPTPVSGLAGAASIAAGMNHTCARLTNGSVTCWGYNGFGQLAQPATQYAYTPVTVAGLGDVTRLDTLANHTCAVLGSGTARCWGQGSAGKLGDGSTTGSQNTPVPIIGD